MMLLREAIRRMITETTVIAYHGTSRKFSKFDPELTGEFGFHFALTPESAQHRSPVRLFRVTLRYDSPLELPDVMRWDLQNIARELRLPRQQVIDIKKKASQNAKEDGRSMRTHENILLGHLLEELGYDAIAYDNRGEAGGKALIIWNPSQIIKQEII